MPIRSHPRCSAGPGIALIAAALLLGLAVSAGLGSGFDAAVARALAMRVGTTPDWAISGARAVTRLGDPAARAVIMLAAMIWLAMHKQSRGAVALAVTVGIGAAAVALLKEMFARARPAVSPHLDLVDSYAYPSGHAANSALILIAAALLIGGRRRYSLAAAGALTFAIGLTRVMLGVHWFSDVLGGWLIGTGCALIAARTLGRR